jgi:carboxyl-terminal processing protease
MNKTPLLKLSFVFVILLTATGLYSCVDDDNKPVSKETLEVNAFIKEVMDYTYLWNTQMPKIDQTQEDDPEAYFYKLLYTKYDKWSFISNDLQGLMDMLSGTETSMGYSVRPYLLKENSEDVVAFVEYVEPNGPADKANIHRGDLLYKINGQKLTTSNYFELIGKTSYSLTLGAITQTMQITELSPTVNLTAVVLHNDAVLLDTIYDLGSKKVGYMVYNTFTLDYSNSLDAALDHFKSGNINELVLDLRYNGGGYDSISTLLASTIGPLANVGKVMHTSTYNSQFGPYLKDVYPNKPELFKQNFISTPNNLNLTRLFVLTTNNTASASETIIYSLKPYMNVVQIGDTTVGKYFGMNIFAGPDPENGPWVMLPITVKASNANNSIVYEKGLAPNYFFNDDYDHELGDKNEELLQKALSQISGTSNSPSLGLKSAMIKQHMVSLKGGKEKMAPLKFNRYLTNSLK